MPNWSGKTMKAVISILLAVLVGAAALPQVEASECGELEPGVITPCECGDTLMTDYVMTEDLLDCPEDGILIGADGITLDCAGHELTGPGATSFNTGVYLGWEGPGTGQSNVTIRNCRIREFGAAIFVRNGATNNHIIDNFFLYNAIGVVLRDADSNGISYNHFIDDELVGTEVTDSSSNDFYHNHFMCTPAVCHDHVAESGDSIGNDWDGNYWQLYDGEGSFLFCCIGSEDHDPHPIPHPDAGDFDEDGDIDLTDYSTLGDCIAGPEQTTPPAECAAAEFDASDLDDDSDVDLDDFRELQKNFDP